MPIRALLYVHFQPMSSVQPPSGTRSASGTELPERSRRFVFGSCSLDTRSLELTVSGGLVKLERKPLEVLIFLLTHAGEVVTKEELLEEVWQGRVLSDSVLTKCIAKLRQGLADDDQSVIRTVHGFGYRLVSDVQVERAPGAEQRLLPELKAGDAPPLRPLWQLVRPLGTGGFGEVWLVSHKKTDEQRVLKFAVDGPGLFALRREITLHRVLRQALGERKDFVRLMDWNLEEAPYYIEVDYVACGSLTDWAEAKGGLQAVPLETRIELVAQIAEALSAAHSVGVLHKDLKPGNVLIAHDENGEPRIRLADFGSGHLIDPTRLEALDITRMGFTRAEDFTSGGTPLYLAPELLHGAAPTARSDIFALGVLLYQMLVCDLRKPLAVGWEQDISDELLREDIAAAAEGRPEQRLSDAAALAHRLRSLDARRVECEARTAAREEAARLKTALAHARQRRRHLGAASAVLSLMLAVVTVLLFQVRTAQDLARQEADIAAAVNEFLITDLLGQGNPMIAGRPDVSVREILDVAATEAGRRFAGREATEAAVRLALGSAYRNLAEFDQAERELSRIHALLPPAVKPTGTGAQALLELARLQIATDRYAEAIETVAPIRQSSEPGLRLQADIVTAVAWQQQGDYAAALTSLAQLLPQIEAHYGEDSPMVIATLGHTAVTLEKLSRYEESIEVHQRELTAMQDTYGEGHVQTLRALRGLGTGHYMLGRLDTARDYVNIAHEIALRGLGPEHDDTLRLASDLGLIYGDLGEDERGEQLMRQTLETRIRVYGEASRDARSLLNNLGMFYGERGDIEREIEYLGRAYRAERQAMGERDPETLVTAHNLARALARAGRVEEAEALERATLATAEEVFGEAHVYVGIMRYTLADILGMRGGFETAEAEFAAAIEMLDGLLEPGNHWSTRAHEARERMRHAQATAAVATAEPQ